MERMLFSLLCICLRIPHMYVQVGELRQGDSSARCVETEPEKIGGRKEPSGKLQKLNLKKVAERMASLVVKREGEKEECIRMASIGSSHLFFFFLVGNLIRRRESLSCCTPSVFDIHTEVKEQKKKKKSEKNNCQWGLETK